jgi:C-terminal processing protease CtpA/Prc
MTKIIGLCLFAATLFTTVSYAQEIDKTETIIGIGATLEKLPDGTVEVDALVPKAPAEHSGLAVGDIILEVKSLPNSLVVDVRALSLPDIVELIRGPVGVPVEISFRRGNSGVTVLSIVREKFDVIEVK